MVMATGSLCHQYGPSDMSHEAAEGAQARGAAAAALHERLVAYVHALAPPTEPRSGVWVEHSYARARGASTAPADVRVLLAPRADAAPAADAVDVERLDAPPPSPPYRAASRPHSPDADAEPDAADDEDDWEARVTAIAPSAAHAALAERALDALRRLRLAKLAAGRAATAEHVGAAARRLRLALVAAAAAPGPAAQRPAPWLHATLLAYMPRAERRLYDEVTAELRRAAPRLAERMTGGRAPPPRRSPLASVGPAVGAEASPWLLWLGGGERSDRRWRRRLGALLHTRVLALPGAVVGGAPPDAWCATVAGAVRAALTDALAEAGDRAVVVGGAGMGAALCAALLPGVIGAAVGGARVCGALLLAPPLLTAEGPRDVPDDPLAEIAVPMLVVAGGGAAQSWSGAVRAVCRGRGGRERRVLDVRGADDALRLPLTVRARRRLPQHALDAAIAEECARWAIDAADARAGERGERDAGRSRRKGEPRPDPAAAALDEEDDDYAHLPAGATAPAAVRVERPIEIVTESPARRETTGANASEGRLTVSEGRVSVCEGRVVSRGSGATPLALLPPRRAAPPTPPPALAAADIMRLPIVFADDEVVPPPAPAPSTPERDADDSVVTVTSGAAWRGRARPYTRVIVASRGAGRGAGAAAGARGNQRPLLLRRAVRLVPR